DTISGKIAKEVFSEMLSDNKTAEQIISEKNISQISDVSELKEIISNIFNDYPKQVKEYIDGKEKLIGFFVGKIMQQTQGKANPKLLNEILKNKLSSLKNN
ncbi:MAG: Asp-tRNA(Asn)/Glu-tRNA(Gln) amidotransferase GatCAB subunit B, partial [Bacteroidetes bacterium]|nr:Asp-tRNA(Asn)/Glu-tRNA(Gln) amidotransferase GatCAB subunit B [Bacteroidota bacterium]